MATNNNKPLWPSATLKTLFNDLTHIDSKIPRRSSPLHAVTQHVKNCDWSPHNVCRLQRLLLGTEQKLVKLVCRFPDGEGMKKPNKGKIVNCSVKQAYFLTERRHLWLTNHSGLAPAVGGENSPCCSRFDCTSEQEEGAEQKSHGSKASVEHMWVWCFNLPTTPITLIAQGA